MGAIHKIGRRKTAVARVYVTAPKPIMSVEQLGIVVTILHVWVTVRGGMGEVVVQAPS